MHGCWPELPARLAFLESGVCGTSSRAMIAFRTGTRFRARRGNTDSAWGFNPGIAGLKPWAESYSPFGARVAGTTLNISYSIPSDRAFLAANAHWH
jgi:hypothetical protein